MIYVYVDGRILGEQKVESNSGIAHSGYNLTIGACPETGRSSQAEFYDIRLYSMALSAAELASQNTSNPAYPANNKDVQLWLDFDNITEGLIMGDVNADGKFDIADAVLFQKWLLGVPNIELANWKAADFTNDDILDVFDLCLMKKALIENQAI